MSERGASPHRDPAPRRRAKPPSPTRGGTSLEIAAPLDAASIADLRNTVARDLTDKFGKGPWSGQCTERGILFEMTRGTLYVAREAPRLVATLTLSRRKPWAIDLSHFDATREALYLTSMAVAPDRQRHGIGRRCMEDAWTIARAWPADAVRLDAYDAAAGASEFYRKCGLREVARVMYRRAPLVYFEMLL